MMHVNLETNEYKVCPIHNGSIILVECREVIADKNAQLFYMSHLDRFFT